MTNSSAKYKHRIKPKTTTAYLYPKCFIRYEKWSKSEYLKVGLFLGIVLNFILYRFGFLFLKPIFGALAVSYLFYEFYLRPKIFNEEITAYYRRDLIKGDGPRIENFKKISAFAIGVIIVDVLIMSVRLYYGGFPLYYYFQHFHYILTPLTFVLVGLFLYWLHFMDKYITVSDYRNRYFKKMSANKTHEWDAVIQIIQEQDKFHGIFVETDSWATKKKPTNKQDEIEKMIESESVRRKPRDRKLN